MYNFPSYARLLALLLPAYMFFVVLWVILLAVLDGGFGLDVPSDFIWWPLPAVFAVASVLLAAATLISMRGGGIDPSELTANAVSAVILMGGAAMAMSAHRPHDAVPFWVSGGVFVALVLSRVLRIGVRRSPSPTTTDPEEHR